MGYVEIYCERVRDLLCPEKDNLRIREEKGKGIWLEDVTEAYAASPSELYDLLAEGNANRAVGATKMNADSSRSHSVVILSLTKKDLTTEVWTATRHQCHHLLHPSASLTLHVLRKPANRSCSWWIWLVPKWSIKLGHPVKPCRYLCSLLPSLPCGTKAICAVIAGSQDDQQIVVSPWECHSCID